MKTTKLMYNILLVMSCHWQWHQHHVLPMVSSMAPFHFLGQDVQNGVQHDFSHVTPLAPVSASCNSDVCMLYKYIHLGMYTDIHEHMYIHTCIYECMYLCIYVYMEQICIYVCTYIHILQTYICRCAYINAYING